MESIDFWDVWVFSSSKSVRDLRLLSIKNLGWKNLSLLSKQRTSFLNTTRHFSFQSLLHSALLVYLFRSMTLLLKFDLLSIANALPCVFIVSIFFRVPIFSESTLFLHSHQCSVIFQIFDKHTLVGFAHANFVDRKICKIFGQNPSKNRDKICKQFTKIGRSCCIEARFSLSFLWSCQKVGWQNWRV